MRGFPILVIAGLAGCAHNVPQDAATGADGRIGGARPIALDNGEGIARGIVTYPGGDRVDWKSIELPAGKRGTLELAMTYTTPRPGLRVAFDVFDQYAAPIKLAVHHRDASIERSGFAGPRSAREAVRGVTIDHARGTYFVRVYAPGRGDAGTYKLVARFTEEAVAPMIEIPDPPTLAAVPKPDEPCDHFDSRNPACGSACPDDAPSTWRACQNTCRTPDVRNPVCWKTMACPSPPDRRVDDCMTAPAKHWKPCADFRNPDPDNPLCDPSHRTPVDAHVMGVTIENGYALVTIDVGSESGIDMQWRGHVLRGQSDAALAGGDVVLVRVEKRTSLVKVHLTADQLASNAHLRLVPP
jgi:hypothetical protein